MLNAPAYAYRSTPICHSRQMTAGAKTLGNVCRPGSSVPISFHLLVSSFCSAPGLCGSRREQRGLYKTNNTRPAEHRSWLCLNTVVCTHRNTEIKKNDSLVTIWWKQIQRYDSLCSLVVLPVTGRVFPYLTGQRHSELRAHAVQTFQDALLPAGLCTHMQPTCDTKKGIYISWELADEKDKENERKTEFKGVTKTRGDALTWALRM